MIPRPYQIEAIDALNAWMPDNDGNPCVVLPTGAGKTPCMAWLIQQYVNLWPSTRIIVLAHVRELLEQGVEKIKHIWPLAPVGVYSAGLKSRDMHCNITYASIQSVWKLACEFDPFDLIFIDEAHRIPLKGDAMYRKFIKDARLANPKVRIVGWTATPYRLNGGPICSPKNILNEVVYEANVKHLIDDGFLCRLKTKHGEASADVSRVHIRSGEFVTSEVMAAVSPKVAEAVKEAAGRLAGRNSILFFCVTIEHARQVSEALIEHGIHAPVISSETDSTERARLIKDFSSGRLRGLCNVNVLSEGFDAQRVDAIVMLRPTASCGMYYQQVGRGLRLHPDKQDCLVLDFAGNILRHGPIDAIKPKTPGTATQGEAPVKVCINCQEYIHASLLTCPECGYEFPKPELKHDITPHNSPILTDSAPWEVTVTDVEIKKHEKVNKPPTLMVTYHGEYERHREWICFEHTGYAQHKAHSWWRRLFPEEPVPKTVDEAIGPTLFGPEALASRIHEKVEWVRVRQVGKYTEIIDRGIKNGHGSMYRAISS